MKLVQPATLILRIARDEVRATPTDVHTERGPAIAGQLSHATGLRRIRCHDESNDETVEAKSLHGV
eukprot:scaffold86545_cov39-Tisochrysis_lutea.AAC.2